MLRRAGAVLEPKTAAQVTHGSGEGPLARQYVNSWGSIFDMSSRLSFFLVRLRSVPSSLVLSRPVAFSLVDSLAD